MAKSLFAAHYRGEQMIVCKISDKLLLCLCFLLSSLSDLATGRADLRNG